MTVDETSFLFTEYEGTKESYYPHFISHWEYRIWEEKCQRT